ncbi:hypothetical protein [Streptomyces indicus]|uniref:Uncharacterized protein n=1 Tax=Streptomyces indicus TaxID=417292 RepID=A0A1G8YZ93_9ACTN|nr:hypothetical protein [Streptomyces indicus]SDK08209.1 hypothetical protein SAMN05421806_104352 [Streptomyces indicus]
MAKNKNRQQQRGQQQRGAQQEQSQRGAEQVESAAEQAPSPAQFASGGGKRQKKFGHN